MHSILTKLGLFGSKLLSIISGLLAVVLIAYSSYVIYDSYFTQQAAFSSWDLSQYRPVLEENGELTFESLMEINQDTVGWLTIQGTNIDYPVVQGVDDLEYANKDVFGKNSLSGSIYLTTANTRDFTNSFNLIYGHHMANGAMFGDIEKYEDYDYFHSHQTGILITPLGVYDLKVFARIYTDAYDSKIYSAGDRKSEEFPEYLEYVKSLAVQWQEGTDIYEITDHIRTYLLAREQNIAENGEFVFSKMPYDAVANGMQLLALSTCADAETNGRQLLVCTMKIRTEPLPEEVIADDPTPLSPFGHGTAEYWSAVDLFLVLLCLYVVFPVGTIRSKYGRVFLMRESNREFGSHYRDRSLLNRNIIGLVLQIGLTACAVLVFLYYENMHHPVTIVDEHTPLFLLLFAGSYLVDLLFFRYRERRNTPPPATA